MATFNKPDRDTIHSELMQEYQRLLGANTFGQASVDPVVSILFGSLASRMAELYSDQEVVRLSVLDELIRGINIEPRRARPAQMVLRFVASNAAARTIEAGSRVLATTGPGERVPFRTDAPFTVSGARIAVALAYQDETLRPCNAGDWFAANDSPKKRLDSVRVKWGDSPSLLLAVDDVPKEGLAGHSFFVEAGTGADELSRVLPLAVWRIADEHGRFGSSAVFMPRVVPPGVVLLNGLDDAQEADHEPQPLPSGFYARTVFVLPQKEDPAAYQKVQAPAALDDALRRLFSNADQVFAKPRVWVRLSLPLGSPANELHTAIAEIALHAMTASNLEEINESIGLHAEGASYAMRSASERFFVGPIAIQGGETNTPYLSIFEPAADRDLIGRYGIREDRIDLFPPKHIDGSLVDSTVNIRLWVTAGDSANQIGPKEVQQTLDSRESGSLRVMVVRGSRGGANTETRGDAEGRFASALFSRGRIVTKADLLAAVRAFDARIVRVTVNPVMRREGRTICTVQRINVTLRSSTFPLDCGDEVVRLREGLEWQLRNKLPFDSLAEVDISWDDSNPENAA